jgi:hypothetical protein
VAAEAIPAAVAVPVLRDSAVLVPSPALATRAADVTKDEATPMVVRSLAAMDGAEAVGAAVVEAAKQGALTIATVDRTVQAPAAIATVAAADTVAGTTAAQVVQAAMIAVTIAATLDAGVRTYLWTTGSRQCNQYGSIPYSKHNQQSP